MTGYAVATRETSAGTLTVELKSVNSRFLDLQFRINDEFRALEPALREALMARLQRGKVECRLSFGRKLAEGTEQALNQELIAALSRMQAQLRAQFANASPLTVNELLRWPGMIAESEPAQESLQADVLALASQALDAIVGTPAPEGAALVAILL